jgi:small conductance mechanosensitive channel
MGSAMIWVIILILYAHLIPVLRSMGTALLAGASVASVVIGLAAQSTLGNLVAGVGYTTLRAQDGHLIVLPNSVAASQVTINLNNTFAPGSFAISIRLRRDADLEAAQRLAVEVAGQRVGEKAVMGCYLTKVDGDAVTLDLRLSAPDAAARDTLRSTLMGELTQRFDAVAAGSSPGHTAAFS